MPSVSIIIAAYNGASTIMRAVRSAQEQTLNDIEIVVVDDASTDATVAIIEELAKEDPRIKLFQMPANGGPSAARNLGIREARGEWIAVLDADDWFEPLRLEALLAAAKANNADAVCDNLKIYDHAVHRIVDETTHGSSKGPYVLTAENFIRADNLIRRHSIGFIQPLIRKSFLAENGITYDPNHRVGEDFLLLAEILLSGAKVIIVPERYYVYVHMYSPTTRKKSPHSHTQKNHSLIVQGCNELITKYALTITGGEREALMKRRSVFERRIDCVEMIKAAQNLQILKALQTLVTRPFILVLIGSAAIKWVYANFLDIYRLFIGKKSAERFSNRAEDIGLAKVSIIISVLNGMRTIGKALESAQAQTEKNIEIVVVDDGSTDGTPDYVAELARADSRIKLIRLEKNIGPPAATNLAIAQATGGWIAILDADDWYEPERIEVFLKTAATYNADVVCDNLKIFDHARGEVIEETTHAQGHVTVLTPEAFFRQDNPMRRHSIGYIKPMVKKKFLSDHKIAYDPLHRVGYDFLFASEILLSGGKIVIIPEAYYVYIHMFSPTTRKKSPYSHTVSNHTLVMRGCEELVAKYARTIKNAERSALLQRRHIFKSYARANEMLGALRNRDYVDASYIFISHPSVLVIIMRALVKLCYANVMNVRHSFRKQRTV